MVLRVKLIDERVEMVIFENVNKFVLKNVSLHIPIGKIVGLIGLSGAGKTTLLKLACGLLQPDSGYVRVMEREPVKYRSYSGKEVAFFAGVPFLCREDTVKESFEDLKATYRISEAAFSEAYEMLSKELGFGAFQNEKISTLSLGQKMRAELGAAFMLKPKLLLLDEPTVGLDANGKAALREILLHSIPEGMTVLITSHDMAEVSKLCDRIAVLHEGKLLYYGSEERLQKSFTPIETMTVKVSGQYPDLEDLPLVSYSWDRDVLSMRYNANYITSAEILRLILLQTEVSEVKIYKPDLESVIAQLSSRR